MQDFIKIFIQEVVSTLEGLVGKAPSVGLKKEVSNNEEASLISAPYARVKISAIEKEESPVELLAPVDLVTAQRQSGRYHENRRRVRNARFY